MEIVAANYSYDKQALVAICGSGLCLSNMWETLTAQGSSDEAALPQAEHIKNLRITYAYLIIAFVYFVIFAPVYALYLHQVGLGIMHLCFALLSIGLFIHVWVTKNTQLATLGTCTLAAIIVSMLVITGGAASSGTYSVFGGSTLLFFMPNRRYYVVLSAFMTALFAVTLLLVLAGFIAIPYSTKNFALFLVTFIVNNVLLLLYGREKAKVDKKLNSSLKEIRVLAHQLEEEKASVEKKVQLRTTQYRKEHAKLAASIKSLEQGFVLVTPDGIVEQTNDRVAGLFQGHVIDAVAKSFAELVQQAGWPATVSRALERVLTINRSQHLSISTEAGSFYEIYITPVMSGVQMLGATIIIEDVTEQKILDRSKDEFFSIASHELRTPLTAIRGNMSLAREYFADAMKDDTLRGIVADTHAASIRLIEIVNDFLDSSKLEQGKMVFTLAPVSVLPVIQNTQKDLLSLSNQQHNKVTLQGLNRLPRIVADEARFRQIVYNVLSNANKYSQHATITISGVVEGNYVRIRVTDTGKGIAPENQKLLFHKFQQAGDSILTRDNTKGTGLGLYISRLLASDMHGRIELERSAVGEGSTFAIVMPRASSRSKH